MSIEHHPPDAMLAAFAAGTLDHGEHVALATHLVSCARCRAFARDMEQVGGVLMTELSPAAMPSGSFAKVQARLTEASPDRRVASPETVTSTELAGLPGFLRRYRFGNWTWVAPSVHLRRIMLPHASDTRVFLLRSGPGTRMLEHTHTGVEMTCVLSGAFRQGGGYFGPGDFDLGDETNDHRPVVEPGKDCICLVAMRGTLRLKGVIGRLVQPFIHL
jgi:putative transcriptional regulator